MAEQVARIRSQNAKNRGADLEADDATSGHLVKDQALALADTSEKRAPAKAPEVAASQAPEKKADGGKTNSAAAALKDELSKKASDTKTAFSNSNPVANSPAAAKSMPKEIQTNQAPSQDRQAAKSLSKSKDALSLGAPGKGQAGFEGGGAPAPLAEAARTAPVETKQRRLRSGAPLERLEPDHVVIWPPRPPHPPHHPVPPKPQPAGDEFEKFTENPYTRPSDAPRSTLSADVDTASFALVRRFLMQENMLPPANAVRIEEMVNYFDYHYAGPKDEHPFAAHVEIASAPWAPKHRLVRIGVKAKHLEAHQRPQANLIFLIDVSGSMRSQDKLPLLKQSLNKLVEALDGDDRIAIVTYSGRTELALPSTPVGQKQKILEAIGQLRASGSTNGGAGIQLAYKTAKENFIRGGVNRVIMTTDGDFNVGITDREKLNELIAEKRRTGVYLSVLGFGLGNLKDATMKNLAKRGNGNYAYIDRWEEGRKVLVEEAGSTLVPVAKDVKFDVEFNPAAVGSYRLIGYEKRQLAAQDFNDDAKDAGEVGSGHTVTVLYEVVPVGVQPPVPPVDPLRYAKKPAGEPKPKIELEEKHNNELLFVRIRYKKPEAEKSVKIAFPVQDSGTKYAESTDDFKVAVTTAGLGLMLRDSKYKGDLTYDKLLKMAETVVDARKEAEAESPSHRRELIKMIRQAKMLQNR